MRTHVPSFLLALLASACAEEPRARWTFEVGLFAAPGGAPAPALAPGELASLPDQVLDRLTPSERRTTQVTLVGERTLVIEGPLELEGPDPNHSFGHRVERPGTLELLVEAGCARLASSVDPTAERARILTWIGSHPGEPLTEYDRVPRDRGGPPEGHVWRALGGSARIETRVRLLTVSDAPFTERDLGSVEPSAGSRGQPALALEIAPERRKPFAEFTQSKLGCNLAIVIDGEIRTLASIRSPLDGTLVVEDSRNEFTEFEIERLKLNLPKGRLAVPLRFVKREYLPPR